MPDTDEVDQALRSPRGIDLPRPHLTIGSTPSLSLKLSLQGHQDRCIYSDQVSATKDGLRHVLRQSDSTACDDRNLVSQSLPHQLLMHFLERSIEMQTMHSLMCQFARYFWRVF